MAIQAPATSQKLMQIFSQLGTGLRDIANPNLEQERQFRNFLLQNPQRASALLGQQQELDEQAAGQIADARQEDVLPNVGQSFGLSREETTPLLQQLGALTPQEEAAQAEGEFNIELFDRLRAEGVPAKAALARARGAELETTEAEFQIDYLDELDPELQAQTENMGNEAKRALAEVERDQGQDYLDFRRQAVNGEIPGLDPNEFLMAESNPQMLSAILQRERLDMRERMNRLDNITDRQEFQTEALKAKFDLQKEMDDKVDRIRGLRSGEIEGNEDDIKKEIQEYNQMVQDFGRVFPGDAEVYYGKFIDEMVGSDVEFRSARGFFSDLAGRNELLDQGVESLQEARETPAELEEFIRDPETGELLPGFQDIKDNMSGRSFTLYKRDLARNLDAAQRDARQARAAGQEGANVRETVNNMRRRRGIPQSDIDRITLGEAWSAVADFYRAFAEAEAGPQRLQGGTQ